jgi:pimeloyl-ACP methyl ester carboxylesterase
VSVVVLIHGAGDGAWIWHKVIAEIEARGHTAVAMDLPCDDEAATFSDDVDAIEAVIPPDAGGDVVVVAHALGGILVPTLAQRRPLRHIVYVCAVVPTPGRTFFDMRSHEPDMYLDGGLTHTFSFVGGCTVFSEESLIADFAVDCPEAEARAYAKRSRPQRIASMMELLGPTPNVPTTSVIGTHDITLNPDWSRRQALAIDAAVVEMDAGHAPMLRDPAGLAEIIVSTVS